MSTLLDKAASKASPRRFTAEGPTGFGALIASDPNLDPRFAALFAPLFTPEEEAAIEAQYAQEEVIDQEEARSIAELAEDHLEQRLEMEADDDRAGFDPF